MRPDKQAFELQPLVEAIYSAKTSREIRVSQIVHLLNNYHERTVIEAISDLIFRYQEHLETKFVPYGGFSKGAHA